MLAVGPVGSVLAEANHRGAAAIAAAAAVRFALLTPVALDAVGGVPVALTPEEKTGRKLFGEIFQIIFWNSKVVHAKAEVAQIRQS